MDAVLCPRRASPDSGGSLPRRQRSGLPQTPPSHRPTRLTEPSAGKPSQLGLFFLLVLGNAPLGAHQIEQILLFMEAAPSSRLNSFLIGLLGGISGVQDLRIEIYILQAHQSLRF